MSLGKRIKGLRFKKGASLQAVANAVGASKPHIWELERGTTKNPSLCLVTKLAKYFGVSVDYLAGMDGGEVDGNTAVRALVGEISSGNLLDSDLELLRRIANTLSEKNSNYENK